MLLAHVLLPIRGEKLCCSVFHATTSIGFVLSQKKRTPHSGFTKRPHIAPKGAPGGGLLSLRSRGRRWTDRAESQKEADQSEEQHRLM